MPRPYVCDCHEIMSVSAFYGCGLCVNVMYSLLSLIQHWSFSRVFEGISSWSISDSPAVCAHLASCPVLHAFAKSYDPTTPWKLSGLGQSLHKKVEVPSRRKSSYYGGSDLPSETSSEED